MNKYENFALGEYLSEWPETMTFDEVIEALRAEHEDVYISEDFESLYFEDLADRIVHLRSWLEQNFIPRS